MPSDIKTVKLHVRKWVFNLWTVALSVLGAAGLNPLDHFELGLDPAPIARIEIIERAAPAGLDESCVLHDRRNVLPFRPAVTR